MNILIVEDNPLKLKNIENAIMEYFSDIHIEKNESYQSGLKSIVKNSYDLVLLDMSLPSHDLKSSFNNVSTTIEGIDILIELKRRNIVTNIVVITQFTDFGIGHSRMTLDMLNKEMEEKFSNYRQTILYVHNETQWKEKLINYIKSVKHD